MVEVKSSMHDVTDYPRSLSVPIVISFCSIDTHAAQCTGQCVCLVSRTWVFCWLVDSSWHSLSKSVVCMFELPSESCYYSAPSLLSESPVLPVSSFWSMCV